MIKCIVACDKNMLIGLKDKMPWYIPEDFKHYKETTFGHAIVMGKTTFEGIGRPLPGRINYVLSREPIKYDFDNVEVVNDIKILIDKYKGSEEILFVSGGASVYKQFYEHSDELIVSRIQGEYIGDVYLPKWNSNMFKLLDVVKKEGFNVEYYEKN